MPNEIDYKSNQAGEQKSSPTGGDAGARSWEATQPGGAGSGPRWVDEGMRVRPPESYMATDPYRRQIQSDLDRLTQLRETGGPATDAARDLQRDQAAAQIALSRGGGGGASLRRGTEASSESYVQSMAPVQLAMEAEKQGYTRLESAAAAMLAMGDTEFRQNLEQLMGDIKRGTVTARQQEAAAAGQTISSGISAGASIAGAVKGNEGGIVPGEGDEDTVPAVLTPGEIVIPKELSAQLIEVITRSVEQGSNTSGSAVRANVGGTVRRDPSTGYLTQEPDAGDYLRQVAELSPGEQVMSRFGGDMESMSEWYSQQKKKPRDWGEALKVLSAGGK